MPTIHAPTVMQAKFIVVPGMICQHHLAMEMMMNEHQSFKRTDEWYTPKYIFDALDLIFDLDVAAPHDGPKHVPASEWYSFNGLEREWFGLVWMNPPFGHQRQKMLWLEKFMRHGNGIALMPDRTSAPWWQKYASQAHAVLFVSPKVKFERPDGTVGNSPGVGTTLFAAGDIAKGALLKSQGVLGTVFTPSYGDDDGSAEKTAP